MVSLEFFIETKSFRSHYGPGVDSSSNRNEYQEHFLGVKSGRYVRLTTLPPSCAFVTKSGTLNFLEPSGPPQACNLPLHLIGGKDGRCIRLTALPPSCAVVMKSGYLNLLEPSGPHQACNWTALPLPLPQYYYNTPASIHMFSAEKN